MSIWIMIILEVLKNVPTIIKIVKEISNLIKSQPRARRRLEMRNLALATKAAKDNKDFRPLEDLRCRLRKECSK